MKILAICGSPRRGRSQTRLLVEAVLSATRDKGAETLFIDAGQADIHGCIACEACHRGPDCVLKDDAVGIQRQMLEADGLILASPVYLDQVTAQMKALLDRTSHFVHCLRLLGKYVAVVTTSGGGSGEATAAFLRSYALMAGAQYAGAVHAPLPLTPAHQAEARRLGETLVAAIQGRQQWSDQLAAIEAQRLFFRNSVDFWKEQWPYEFAYWQKMGWV